MADVGTLIHYLVTGITATGGVVLAYLKYKDDRLKKQGADNNVCQKDFQDLKTKVAVLEERLDNEIEMLQRFDEKLDKIRDAL